jgi:hypothetical protein
VLTGTRVTRYRELRGTGKASSEVGKVVLAAQDGRVDVLFVAEEGGPTEDLLDLTAIHTILSRGTVYAVPPADMPDGAAVAAVFRF